MKRMFEKAPAWAFEFEGSLCYWAHPNKGAILKEMKKLGLSDSYNPIPVYIIRRKDLRKKTK